MRIIGTYRLAAQETNLITLGTGTVWREVRRLEQDFVQQNINLPPLISPFIDVSVDCTGGSEGSSYSHLTVDSDWQHHWRVAAIGPYHFHTLEGI